MAHVPGHMSHPPQHALRVQRAGPETPFDPAGLFVLDPLVPAALGGQRLLHLADQWQAGFIRAGDWRPGVVGVGGDGQPVFQAGPASGVRLGGIRQDRLRWSLRAFLEGATDNPVGHARAKPRATAWSASSRRVQRARPSGASKRREPTTGPRIARRRRSGGTGGPGTCGAGRLRGIPRRSVAGSVRQFGQPSRRPWRSRHRPERSTVVERARGSQHSSVRAARSFSGLVPAGRFSDSSGSRSAWVKVTR